MAMIRGCRKAQALCIFIRDGCIFIKLIDYGKMQIANHIIEEEMYLRIIIAFCGIIRSSLRQF